MISVMYELLALNWYKCPSGAVKYSTWWTLFDEIWQQSTKQHNALTYAKFDKNGKSLNNEWVIAFTLDFKVRKHP